MRRAVRQASVKFFEYALKTKRKKKRRQNCAAFEGETRS